MARTEDRPTGDENDAAAAPVVVPTEPLAHSEEARTSGGAKWIRVPNGEFVLGDTRVDQQWRDFNATQAKELIEAAERNGVRLAVADKKG